MTGASVINGDGPLGGVAGVCLRDRPFFLRKRRRVDRIHQRASLRLPFSVGSPRNMASVLYGVEALLHARAAYHGAGLNCGGVSEFQLWCEVFVFDWFGEGV